MLGSNVHFSIISDFVKDVSFSYRVFNEQVST